MTRIAGTGSQQGRSANRYCTGASCALFLLASACQQEPADEAGLESLTAAEVRISAVTAMGGEGLSKLEIQAEGWEACLGQPWNINEGWARWLLSDYKRVFDYSTGESTQTAQRQAGMDPDKLGGCGAQPDAAPQNQRSSVSADASFVQQLPLLLSPMGFLALSQNHPVEIADNGEGLTLTLDIQGEAYPYRVEGLFGDDFLLDRVNTWIDDTVYGRMPVTIRYGNYRDFGGYTLPASVVMVQGDFPVLDLTVNSYIPDTPASATPPESQGGRFGGGGQGEPLPDYEEIGTGIYALHGAYQSVVVEFDEFSMVLDGLQNDARVEEIIRLTKEIVPDKPIRYVLVTHAHFDHASGLRQFVAEGASIITHNTNVNFFTRVLTSPRLEVLAIGQEPEVIGVDDFLAIDDGIQRVEFHKLGSGLHADDMLIAYIPSINTIVEADLLQPWINPVFGGGDHPYLIYLADELDNLPIDYRQFVPIHRPPNPPLMTREDLLDAVGRGG